MTIFLDLRATPSGGFVAKEVTVFDGATQQTMGVDELRTHVDGRSVVLVVHGFNVSMDSGVRSLSHWDQLSALPSPHVFVGVLWPGDSRFLPVVDYPIEGGVAMGAGRLLAPFLDEALVAAASVSFVSHSLGVRVVLETIRLMERRQVSTIILMAAAIEDDALSNEYADAIAKVARLHVVASLCDLVLEFAFPVGNPLTELLLSGHPLFRRALGRQGPRTTAALPSSYQLWQAPVPWDYGHLDYLPHSQLGGAIAPPIVPPRAQDAMPTTNPLPWQASWSATIIATQFR
ncbi:MAG: alpha/beta hydrolase [Proteobacteria bacterium]|nr:alpha/beta hydrolase [Pseudomonadota bacterium]